MATVIMISNSYPALSCRGLSPEATKDLQCRRTDAVKYEVARSGNVPVLVLSLSLDHGSKTMPVSNSLSVILINSYTTFKQED
ncbi:hypothetical protein TNCV_3684551 [Trichonephila clavipes]|uniref:Uncharacterized protein n=1 Tax=Trichonephila clavipes TaxID=2585209 RepID=A0A8X6V5N2_TRICX|nr:hypothetical protein TNCV_3684551 [Trichonephila clavipes]